MSSRSYQDKEVNNRGDQEPEPILAAINTEDNAGNGDSNSLDEEKARAKAILALTGDDDAVVDNNELGQIEADDKFGEETSRRAADPMDLESNEYHTNKIPVAVQTADAALSKYRITETGTLPAESAEKNSELRVQVLGLVENRGEENGTADDIKISVLSNAEEEDLASPSPDETALPLPTLGRGRNHATWSPGAVAIEPSGQALHRGHSQPEYNSQSHEDQDPDNIMLNSADTAAMEETRPREEHLVNAILVPDGDHRNDDDMDIVEATAAHTGWKAIVYNPRFKYLVVMIVAVLIAIMVPVAVLVPDNKTTLLEQGPTCGNFEVNQRDYRGTTNVTLNGNACQRWDSQTPWRHSFSPEDYPNAGLEENYCRNPGLGKDDLRVWCYTVTGVNRREECDVPYCDLETKLEIQQECGTSDKNYLDYVGNTSITATGRPCQRYDSQYPHAHGHNPGLPGREDNFCRNPTGDPFLSCYTMDKNRRQEICDVPPCPSTKLTTELLTNATMCEGNCTSTECGTMRFAQKDYRGFIDTTWSGRTCQRWDTQFPHGHQWVPEKYPNAGLDDNNFCRNAEFDEAAWCYTTDPLSRWEYCNVPLCPDPFVPRRRCGTASQLQMDYRGEVSRTESGLVCNDWLPYEAADKFPLGGLVANYCRNNYGFNRSRAWCFVGNLLAYETSWEYCTVDECRECGSVAQNKSDYQGDTRITRSGKRCRNWEDSAIRPYLLDSADTYSGARDELMAIFNFTMEWGLEGNFCRNPESSQQDVWCFVESQAGEDPLLAWEHCDVPVCSEEESSCDDLGEKQGGYRGTKNTTVGNQTCQNWASQFPHEHKLDPASRPLDGLDNNFCRNPDGSDGAWCFTVNASIRWQYCDIDC